MIVTCRYCPLYCPSPTTPIYGYCTGPFPPLSVDLRDSYPFEDCPYKGDVVQIDRIALYRGFSDRRLKRLEYYAVNQKGIRTRFYSDLSELKKDLSEDLADGLHYSLYVVFVDTDGCAFYRAVIPEDPPGPD